MKIANRLALTRLDALLKEGLSISGSVDRSPEESADILNREGSAWISRAEDLVKDIFEDVEPMYRFSRSAQVIDSPVSDDNKSFLLRLSTGWFVKKDFMHKLSVIADFYREIEKRVAEPIEYIDSRSSLVHFDRVCSLGAGTNERALCRYMFANHDFEELVQFEQMYEALFGDSEDEERNAKKVASAAYEVNKKTRDEFGFQLFKVTKGMISLQYPQ